MLCNENHRVGLAGFATGVRLLEEIGPVEPGKRRDRMLRQIKGVRSTGRYTDIQDVLRQALAELKRDGRSDHPRAVLLMTDGKVDLGRGEEADKASIAGIRGPLATEFIQAGVEIHCIAFSSSADRDLLERLSEATGGLCVQGDRDDELQRLFLRLFEELAQPQTVPITNNRVPLDLSVREATFLITHGGDGEPVRLVQPDGRAITEKTSDRFEGVRWFSAPRYELVAVARPQEGVWRIEPAMTTRDDRVIVLTDVELQAGDFNSMLRAGEDCPLTASLRSQGEPVREPEMLTRLAMQGTLQAGYSQSVFPLEDDGSHNDGAAKDGVFGGGFAAPDKPGAYDIEIIARVPPLERRIVRTVKVADRWFKVHALRKEVLRAGEPMTLTAEIVDPRLARAAGEIDFVATVLRPDGSQTTQAVIPLSDVLFSTAYYQTSQKGSYRVTVTGNLTNPSGGVSHDTVGPLDFAVSDAAPGPLAVPPGPQKVLAPPTAVAAREPAVPLATTPSPPVEAADRVREPEGERGAEAAPGPGLLSLAVQAGAVIALLAIVGLFGLRVMRSRGRRAAPREPSMAALRKRAADIRRETFEKGMEGEPGPKSAEIAAAPTVVEPVEAPPPAMPPTVVGAQGTPLAIDSADIIPAGDPGVVRQNLAGQVLVEASAGVDEGGGQPAELAAAGVVAESPASKPGKSPAAQLDDSEQDLLAEIMAETEEDKSEIMGESAGGGASAKIEPEEGLTDSESELLTEIMAEPGAGESSAGSEGLSEAESDLLDEVMGEASAEESGLRTGDRTPTIPHERDRRSDEDAINDILKEIQGLMR
jgi:uncharacterized protein (TIGR03503 family)